MRRELPHLGDEGGVVLSPWHWWFAWRPVRTWDGRIVWLVPVKRRRVWLEPKCPGPCIDHWDYHFPWGYAKGGDS